MVGFIDRAEVQRLVDEQQAGTRPPSRAGSVALTLRRAAVDASDAQSTSPVVA